MQARWGRYAGEVGVICRRGGGDMRVRWGEVGRGGDKKVG